jgi:hypothetical protein
VINNIIAYLNNFTIYIYKELNMKKLLLASLITATSFGASASAVITFDDSSFGGTAVGGVVYDGIDFDQDSATVTQTDTDSNGHVVGGNEDFTEFGNTEAVNFKLGSMNTGVDSAYEVFFNYSFTGDAFFTAATGPGTLNQNFITFDSTVSGLYVDTVVDQSLTVGATQVASFDLQSGFCLIGTDRGTGFCDITLNVNYFAGYFTDVNGVDLSTTVGNTAQLNVTVQDIFGFSETYSTPGASQQFTITHDGNMTFEVPEPASVAILGLGLLGFAGARRRKA